MKHIIGTAVLLVSLAAPAWAGYENGLAAYQSGDYETALREWREAAEQGNAKAQNNLGFMYQKGLGVPPIHAEAARWYMKAAEQGESRAQVSLGLLYLNGRGVPQDYAEAARWWLKAAEQGELIAQVQIAMEYFRGRGVPPDPVRGHMWAEIAVSGDHPDEFHDHATSIRDLIASYLTPGQIAEAQRLAREWMTKFEKRKKQ